MQLSYLKDLSLLKESFQIGLACIGVLSSFLGILGFSLVDVGCTWLHRLLIIFFCYITLFFFIALFKVCQISKGISFKIRGMNLVIEQGDIFEAKGWKVIGFNEYFDTQVDDVIIAKNSLNGKFISTYVKDIGELHQRINSQNSSTLTSSNKIRNGVEVLCYPLGCIKTYDDYMLLALTHFSEQNEAYFEGYSEYEQCLRNMWKEISRTYANKPVFLPLLGTGIARFKDVEERSSSHLLKCMICTLKSSNVQINQPITILLTRDMMKSINLYDLKGV